MYNKMNTLILSIFNRKQTSFNFSNNELKKLDIDIDNKQIKLLEIHKNKDLIELYNYLNDNHIFDYFDLIQNVSIKYFKFSNSIQFQLVYTEQRQLYKAAFLIELNQIDEAYNNLRDIEGVDILQSYDILKNH